MKYTTPEKMGIKSSDIKEYLETLEKHELSTHDVIIARHGEIVFETYWEPFKKDDLHRMYSVTKSFVSMCLLSYIHIGFREILHLIIGFANIAHSLFHSWFLLL